MGVPVLGKRLLFVKDPPLPGDGLLPPPTPGGGRAEPVGIQKLCRTGGARSPHEGPVFVHTGQKGCNLSSNTCWFALLFFVLGETTIFPILPPRDRCMYICSVVCVINCATGLNGPNALH